MARGDDIEERLIDFAARIIRVCDALSDKPAGMVQKPKSDLYKSNAICHSDPSMPQGRLVFESLS